MLIAISFDPFCFVFHLKSVDKLSFHLIYVADNIMSASISKTIAIISLK